MTALIVIGGILLLLLLLSLLRVGGSAEYSEAGAVVRARVGALRFQVYPAKREKKPKKEKKSKEEPKKEPKGGPVEQVKTYLPLICRAAGELKRKIRVDTLVLHFTAAASDPAMAAISFGGANALLGMFWPVLEQNFNIRDHDLGAALDFQAQRPAVYVYGAFSARVGQLVSFAVRFGIPFLKLSQTQKPNEKQKEAV